MDSIESKRQILKDLNKQVRESNYFKKFNQKRYTSPKGYIDTDTISLITARELYIYSHFYTIEMLENNFTHGNSFSILLDAYQKDFKTIYLDKNLLEAFKKTQPPADTTKLKRSVPNGLLILPVGIKFPGYDTHVKWIMFRHSVVGEIVKPIELTQGGTFGTVTNPDDYLSWFTVLDDKDKTQYTKNIRLSKNYREDPAYNNYIYDPVSYIDSPGEFLQTEAEVTNLITDILIQSLLYIQTNEPVIEHRISLQSKKNFLTKPSKSKIKPWVLGEGFKPVYLKNISSNTSKDNIKGTAKATHWRRGHYRWQPYGSKDNPQYKSIWIEPVLINNELHNH